jgi:UDP-2-acetamido-3-amino-2,3-dideoxy-glucuronate N-acetyltransferase
MLLDQMNELRDARLIKLPKHAAANGYGVLVVAETAQQVPFQIQGMFTIVAPAGAKRGQHAHRLCSQFMVCVKGAVDAVCDDGSDRKTCSLDSGELAVLVPSGL